MIANKYSAEFVIIGHGTKQDLNERVQQFLISLSGNESLEILEVSNVREVGPV